MGAENRGKRAKSLALLPQKIVVHTISKLIGEKKRAIIFTYTYWTYIKNHLNRTVTERRQKMAVIFSYGLAVAIGLFVGLIFTVIGLFFGHIILFDSIFFSVIVGIICNQMLGVHTALCLLIGLTLFGLLFKLQTTSVGFWIIGVLLSAFWAGVFCLLAFILTEHDMVWTYVVLGLSFVIMMGLHLQARAYG